MREDTEESIENIKTMNENKNFLKSKYITPMAMQQF